MSTIHSQTTEPQDFDIEVPDTDATDYTWVPKNRPEVMKGTQPPNIVAGDWVLYWPRDLYLQVAEVFTIDGCPCAYFLTMPTYKIVAHSGELWMPTRRLRSARPTAARPSPVQ